GDPIELQLLKLVAVHAPHVVKSSTRVVPGVEGCQQKTGGEVIDVARRVDMCVNRAHHGLVDIDGDARASNGREKKTNVRLVLNVVGDSVSHNKRGNMNFLT